MDRLSEIRARCEAATPGPWKWDLRTTTRQCKLVTDHSGHYYVMDFARWGTQDACPRLQVYDKYEGPVTERGSHGMVRADKLAKSYPGQEHHRGFDDYIDHPDADFIAHARDDIPYLLARLEKAEAERDAAKAELSGLATLINWVEDNFGWYMPKELFDRTAAYNIHHYAEPPKGV